MLQKIKKKLKKYSYLNPHLISATNKMINKYLNPIKKMILHQKVL